MNKVIATLQLAVALLLCCALHANESGPNPAPDPGPGSAAPHGMIWLAFKSPVPVWNSFPPDFMGLFTKPALWPRALKAVRVYKFYGQFLSTSIPNGGSSDADFKTALDFLKMNNIAIAVEMGLLASSGLCGQVEGFCGEEVEAKLKRLKQFSADLAYIAMDEPVYFGNFSQDKKAPHWSLEQVADNLAKQVAIVRKYYPDVKVGDIEPVAGTSSAAYLQALQRWPVVFERATGTPLRFFHGDVMWKTPNAKKTLAQIHKTMKSANVDFGIIYNAGIGAENDVEWTAAAERNFVEVESDSSEIPEHAVIQTWEYHPTHALPDGQAGTLTNLVNRYAAKEARLVVQKNHQRIDAQLLTEEAPLGGLPVKAQLIDDGQLKIVSNHILSAMIPPKAKSALLGLRINTECGGCQGKVDVFLGAARFQDSSSKDLPRTFSLTPSPRIKLDSSQKVLFNSERFPVQEGDEFSVSVPMQVPVSSRETGGVVVIFFDDTGIEMKRMSIPFEPGQRLGKVVNTDAQGRASFSSEEIFQHTSVVNLEFDGNEQLRSVSQRLQKEP